MKTNTILKNINGTNYASLCGQSGFVYSCGMPRDEKEFDYYVDWLKGTAIMSGIVGNGGYGNNTDIADEFASKKSEYIKKYNSATDEELAKYSCVAHIARGLIALRHIGFVLYRFEEEYNKNLDDTTYEQWNKMTEEEKANLLN